MAVDIANAISMPIYAGMLNTNIFNKIGVTHETPDYLSVEYWYGSCFEKKNGFLLVTTLTGNKH